MKTILRHGIRALLIGVISGALFANALCAAGDIEEAFRDALYAEEVKGDLESALKAYQDVGARFELQRDLASAALFREGECLRKLGQAPNSYKPLDDAALEAFRVAWKAAHWRDNPRLSHAVWLSRSESALKARQEPSFVAVLGDESAAGPPTLREVIGLYDQSADWANVTIIRQKDRTEQVIPVDVLGAGAISIPPRQVLPSCP